MKPTTVTAGILCLLSSFGMLVCCILPAWRVGIGNKFMEELPGMLSIVTYETRQYGLIYVTGQYRMSWRALARSTCDKWTAVYFLAMGESIGKGLVNLDASDSTHCVASENDACPNNFSNHMMARCGEYQNFNQSMNVVLAMISLSFMITLGSCLLLFLGSIKSNRDLIFTLLVFADLCLFVGTSWYVHITDKGFKALGDGATYPYPKLGWSFWAYFFFVCMHVFGVLMFGWCKIFSKWIFGSSRPEGWIPPGQRHLYGPGAMAPGGPGPRPQWAQLPPGGGYGPVHPGGFGPPGQPPAGYGGQPGYGAPPGPAPPGMAPYGPPM